MDLNKGELLCLEIRLKRYMRKNEHNMKNIGIMKRLYSKFSKESWRGKTVKDFIVDSIGSDLTR